MDLGFLALGPVGEWCGRMSGCSACDIDACTDGVANVETAGDGYGRSNYHCDDEPDVGATPNASAFTHCGARS